MFLKRSPSWVEMSGSEVDGLVKSHDVDNLTIQVLNLDTVVRMKITVQHALCRQAAGTPNGKSAGSLGIDKVRALVVHRDGIVVNVEKIPWHSHQMLHEADGCTALMHV